MPQVNRQTMRPGIAPSRRPIAPPLKKVATASNGKSAWDLAASVRMLLYGASGTGKTTFAATAPGPILWLVCSGGNSPGELRSIDTPEYREKITPVVVESSSQYEEELGRSGNFATIVLDHSSGFSDLLLREIMGVDEIPVSKFRKASKGESWSLVSQQQYGQLSIKCKEAFRDLLNLPVNVVIIAQERVFGDEATGEIIKPTVGAALTPSVTGWLNPACDYVVQTFKRPKMEQVKRMVGTKEITTTQRARGVEYCLRTEPHDVYMTKFRLPRGHALPDVIVDPTWDKVEAVIRGEYVAETD